MSKIPEVDAQAAAFVRSVRDQLRRARARRDWTVEDLAQLAGISLQAWEQYEEGKADLEVIQLQQVCPVLNLDIVAVLDKANRIAGSIHPE